MDRFDLLGPLPGPGRTTVLEASAGTGKTFALAGLVTRYLAEGVATLDEMLLITFSRAASRELRERVRAQVSQTVAALCDPTADAPNELVAHLMRGSAADRDQRCRRLRDALAGFDAATIATTHEFCSMVLKSLGVAGDTDAGVTLVESLEDLDFYAARLEAAGIPVTRMQGLEVGMGGGAGAFADWPLAHALVVLAESAARELGWERCTGHHGPEALTRPGNAVP